MTSGRSLTWLDMSLGFKLRALWSAAFSWHCDLKLSHLIGNLSVSPPGKMDNNNPQYSIPEWGVVKLNKIYLQSALSSLDKRHNVNTKSH